LLVISGILLIAVQNPGSSISLDRLRQCWNGTSFCCVASAVLAGWTKRFMWSCVCWMLPALLNEYVATAAMQEKLLSFQVMGG